MSDRSIPRRIERAALLASLKTISIDGSAVGALAPYVEQDLDRFLITLNLANVPATKALEIGSNPYFLTILLRWFRPELQVEQTNFFGHSGTFGQTAILESAPLPDLPTRFEFRYTGLDVETQRLPCPDASLDLVLFCEVLEHFIVDPYHALLEIRRCLRPGGHLLLTTPNVSRLENIARMLLGHNIYDPYSGHGPHGRHNREYTRHEVAWLLGRLGFEAVSHFTADVHPLGMTVAPESLPLPPNREHDFGQYQFHLWKRLASDGNVPLRPAWLYRSRPDELDPALL